tara:strand:- start:1306 stop:1761 length:456 start_codon:yes stop_codon:yes gene_type:complete
MSKLDFKIIVDASVDTMMSLACDYENYKSYLPQQVKNIKIVEENENSTITEEVLVFSSILKKELIIQSLHKKTSTNEIFTKILSGPAKDTEIKIQFNTGKQTEINVDVNLKLSLKAKILEPLIKKQYKLLLTGIFLKMNTGALELQNANSS